MQWIVPAIATLEQHLKCLECTPTVFRPPCCPTCGVSRLWAHGGYLRKADRTGGLKPIRVPRFWCTGCESTCSSLPACLSPRRWYDWATQAVALLLLLAGESLRACADRCGRDRRTVRRWWRGLQARHEQFAFFLKGRWAALGLAATWQELWRGVLAQQSLADVMGWLHGQGLRVP